MTREEILKYCDHTNLKVEATNDDIAKLCDEGIKYGCASVCIPPRFVKFAKEYVGEKIKICTVIGFPNGYNTVETKTLETRNAIIDGVDEIDMVINNGQVKMGDYDGVLYEIKKIRNACPKKVLKVIIETCLLTNEQIVKLCKIVSASGADYIKTSTGFSKSGANFEVVELMAKNVENGLKIKAAGGIKSFEDAEKYIKLGCERLGTSSLVKICEEE
ncbi:MAG: deoxyribose-phosphate aldolase [Clostridia bacterium]|nr:deoxyribose-phosphate aldolase [Clostridia bacterium]